MSEPQIFKITFARTGKVFDCDADTEIMKAAAAAGLRLPRACEKGFCGTCKSKKLSGEVEINHNGGIRQREIDMGLFLPCCSKPRSDVVFEK